MKIETLLLLLAVVTGWILFFVSCRKLRSSESQRHAENHIHSHETDRFRQKLADLQEKLDSCQTSVDYAIQWESAPEMLEELTELRQLLLLTSGNFLSDDAAKQISKTGWGVFHSPDTDFSTLMSTAENRIRTLVASHRAVLFEPGYPVVPEIAAIMLDAFDGHAWRYSHFSSKSDVQRLQFLKLAFYLINLRAASAFHASISREYLDAHIELFQVKLALEEQKRQRREEEKSIRQFESQQYAEEARHLREYERLKKKLEFAHAAEKAALEHQIAELLQKIESLRRATSNAQLTRQGTVYVISNIGSFGENVYKIGMTRRTDPQERISELSSASVPFPFDVHAFINTSDAPKLEYDLHEYFKSKKMNTAAIQGREFYRVSLDEIQTKVKEMGYSVKWETTADAAQYRASIGSSPVCEKSNEFSVQAQQVDKEYPSTSDSLIAFLNKTNIKWVDKRNVGGCLWIESTPISDPLLSALVIDGKPIMHASKTRNFNGAPGWYVA